MPSLRDQQELLQAAILAVEENAPIVSRQRSPRLAIYRHAYRARLAGALALNYPVLARVLGDAAFERLAEDYARAVPSRHFSIRWHGAELYRFLTDPALVDLARMEWALGTAFDAADAGPLDAGSLARIPVAEWPGLRLALHPSVSVLAMQWAVEAQWESMRAEDAHAAPAAPQAHAHALLVWRKDLQAHWRIASAAEGAALLALGARGTLQETCEALGEDDAPAVGAWFAGWIAEGMLMALEGAHP